MVLGLSKVFVIFLFLSLAVGHATGNWKEGAILMGIFMGVTIVWRFLTK